jgi:aldose 1-epimerase
MRAWNKGATNNDNNFLERARRQEVSEIAIAAGDLSVQVITLGAVIRDLRLAGIDHPLVLTG